MDEGLADMAVTHLRLSGTLDGGRRVLRTPIYIAMAEGSELASGGVVRASDLVGRDVYYYACGFDEVFWAPPPPGARAHYENDIMFIYEQVRQGEGLFPTPPYTIPDSVSGVTARPLKGGVEKIDIFCYLSARLAAEPRLRVACERLRRELAAGWDESAEA